MTPKQKPIRERDIEKYLVAEVRRLGGEVRKIKWVGRGGAPDRLVMLPGTMRHSTTLWVEVKSPGIGPEQHQHREHSRMRKMGQRVEIVDSFLAVDLVLSLESRGLNDRLRPLDTIRASNGSQK